MNDSPGINYDSELMKLEIKMKETELAIKQAELQSKANEKPAPPAPRPGATSPLTIAVITGIIGLLGAGVANILQTRSNLQLERQKFESSLMLKAIETGNPEGAARNLLFLIKVGLIQDPSGKIAALEAKPQDAPVLPVSSGAAVPIPRTASAVQIFFDRYVEQFGPLDNDRKLVFTKLFSLIEKDKEMTDVRHVAYTLATIKWETANTLQPITEMGSDEALEKLYGPDTAIGRTLGNTEPGDGARYKGRGYLLLTGKRNYAKANQLLGLAGTDSDLLKNPDKALDPEIAYRITGFIMHQGVLTGKKLQDYINDSGTNYVEARRIVNGLNKAAEIAEIAKKFEQILRESVEKSN
jgi:putative chitinase